MSGLVGIEQAMTALRLQAEGQADALVSAAVTIRESGATFTADQVADMLTGFAATTNISASTHFGGES